MDLKQEVEAKLNPAFMDSIFSEVQKKSRADSKENVVGLCPFHEETEPSFSYSRKTGQYSCFSCGAKGNIYTYVKEIKGKDKPLLWLAPELGIEVKPQKAKLKINPDIILDAKDNLVKENRLKVDQLVAFGISEKIIISHNIGYKAGRFWFPIKDEVSDFVNIRKYDPESKKAKIISHAETRDGKRVGFGEDRLYPISALNKEVVYIFEGEKDTLVARSIGINGITNTTGAKNWSKYWSPKFKDKNVIICMDIDAAGRDGALIRAKSIFPFAAQVKIIHLPLDDSQHPRGDFTDYITVEGHTKDEFLQLVEDAPVYGDGVSKDNNEYKVILAEASKSKYIEKKCYIKNVLCCGKDHSPYGAPKSINAICFNTKRSGEKCFNCKLLDGSADVEIKRDDPVLLELIRENKQTILGRLKQYLGIVGKCKSFNLNVKEFYAIEKIRLVPDITYNIEEDYEHVYRIGYYITDDDTKIETNRSYNVHALTCLDTRSQHVQHQIYDIESSDTNIEDFVLDDASKEKLKKFQVEPGKTIDDKVNEIYKDLSRLSHIYDREDMYLMIDLVYHSALTFDFQNKNIGKGWVEGAIVGDSAQGKSVYTKFICHHYGVGEFVSGESNSYAGLIGGLSQIGGNWQLQWGRIPLNDRRLVVIDEASGMSTESIASFSEIRSSGEAKIQKVMSEQTRARCRLLWLSNPRKDNVGIKNYPYGVQVIREIFGQPEDVRRVDIAMTVASGEVSNSVVNKTPETFVPKFDSDSCHSLCMFAWSRKSTDILIDKEVEKHILKKACELSEIYSASIPLIEPADVRNKIARLTVSFAIRLFAIDEKGKVRPTIEHVDYIIEFIKKLYNKPRFAYNDYSKKEFAKTNLLKPRDVCEILNLSDLENVEDLLDSAIVSKMTISDCINSGSITDWSTKEKGYRDKIKKLRRLNAIDEREKYYILQPGFIDFLKELKPSLEADKSIDNFLNKSDRRMDDGTELD